MKNVISNIHGGMKQTRFAAVSSVFSTVLTSNLFLLIVWLDRENSIGMKIEVNLDFRGAEIYLEIHQRYQEFSSEEPQQDKYTPYYFQFRKKRIRCPPIWRRDGGFKLFCDSNKIINVIFEAVVSKVH